MLLFDIFATSRKADLWGAFAGDEESEFKHSASRKEKNASRLGC
jgi:hypothetical protein